MYGKNGGRLRKELATLLRQHRIQQRLGGAGLWTLPETTTLEQRRALGEQIGRYRHAVLVWCLQAVTAASPHTSLTESTGPSSDPVEELRRRLTRAVQASTAGLPSLGELTAKQPFEIVEIWREAARGTALGEHDFTAGVGYGNLDQQQCMTVINDAAEITQALVVLDKRYDNIPTWTPLKDPGRLNQAAATVCAAVAGYGEQDLTVDLRGWRPPPATIDGPPLPGIGGVLQAAHNTMIGLTTFPNAHNLRLVLDSQRVLSGEAAHRVRTVAPTLADKWLAREQTYTTLLHRSRDLGGLLGRGGLAAAEGANSVSRLRRLRRDEFNATKPLRQIDRVLTQIDARVSDVIEHGTNERLYYFRVRLPRVVDQSGGPSKPVRERYVPISTSVQNDLLAVVRTRLQPHPERATPPPGAAKSRDELHDALTHQPVQRRGTSPSQTSSHVSAVGL